MAESSKIAWTRSTFNPWIGCTRVGPGCDHCYAEALDARKVFGGATHWGSGVPRWRTSEKYWTQPLRWNKAQEKAFSEFALGRGQKPEPWRVFCASLADVFDNEAPKAWREDLWRLIDATPYLSWLLVTKRIGNVRSMLPDRWSVKIPDQVRILITVVNQEEADRDVPKLLSIHCRNGISYEPALGPVVWSRWNWTPHDHSTGQIEWIIVGGESAQGGAKARPFVHGWARDTIRQCKAAGVPVFVKQMGSNATNREGVLHPYKDRAGADPAEWPLDLRVREFPR